MTLPAPTSATLPGHRLPARLAFFHGVGAIAYGVKDIGFSTFLLLFYNQVLGMDARMVSLALALALVLDALLDPLIGHLGDRTRSSMGRRLPWLYLSAVPLGLAWTFLWLPSANTAPQFLELVVLAMLVRALISCCEVPSIALVPELTRDYDERTRLVRYRFLFAWVGGLVMLFLAYRVFLTDGMLSAEGYHHFGIAGGVLITLSVLASAAGQHKVASTFCPAPAATPLSLSGALREVAQAFGHPAFLVILSAEAFVFTSQGVTFAIANYLYLFVWRFSEAAFQVYPFLLFASVVTTFLLVGPLHKVWGKRDTATRCILGGMGFLAAPFFLRLAYLWPAEGTTASTGLVFAFIYCGNVLTVCAVISIVSMIADCVEASEMETGRRNEGTFYSGHLFAQKCASGLGLLITGLLLSWAGLPDQAQPGAVKAEVLDKLSLGYAALISVCGAIVAVILHRFPIDRADHEARLIHLASRQASGDTAS